MTDTYNLLDNLAPEQVKRYLNCGYNYMIVYEKYLLSVQIPVQCRFPVCTDEDAKKYVTILTENGCKNPVVYSLVDVMKGFKYVKN